MEDVLDIYEAEHSEKEPLICMDEASKQVLELVCAVAIGGQARPATLRDAFGD